MRQSGTSAPAADFAPSLSGPPGGPGRSRSGSVAARAPDLRRVFRFRKLDIAGPGGTMFPAGTVLGLVGASGKAGGDHRRDYEGWHGDFRQLIDAIDTGEALLWSLFVRPALTDWRRGRAILIGDAAHSTMPNIAQGAAMAMEDAAVPARVLSEGGDPIGALDRFRKLRIPRTTRIVNAAAGILSAFHGDDPHQIRADLRSGQSALSERDRWLYNYNPMTVPLADRA